MSNSSVPLKVVIFADLDGTLLDRQTYEAGPAGRALDACDEMGIPVVLASSKTCAEIEEVRRRLQNRFAFISENGGGIFLPMSHYDRPASAEPCGPYWKVGLGAPYPELVKVLRQAAQEAGARVIGFSDLDPAGVAERTGLGLGEALMAKQREFDEPFWVVNDAPEVLAGLVRQIEARGYSCSRGGRLHHISGCHTKGDGVRYVKRLFLGRDPALRFAAFGDAENDLPMFKEVDFPFLVRSTRGQDVDVSSLQGVYLTRAEGPQGFVEGFETLRVLLSLC